MKGLAPHTQAIFDSVSMLDCLKPFHLVGGTALSLQIGTRQSEDLDFMQLEPVYDITPNEIEEYIKVCLMEARLV